MISDSALRGDLPLNGLRHPPEAGTNGWFIWGGEYSTDPEFFKPIHVSHLKETCPAVTPHLALPP
ncbi:immunity protein Imm33 domain-containing protein [Rhizobium brockwellii]